MRVPESQLDAVTGLSGSGPAYVMLVAEALTEAMNRAYEVEETRPFLPRTALAIAFALVLLAAVSGVGGMCVNLYNANDELLQQTGSDSNHGSAIVTPMPFSTVRREMFLLVINIRSPLP